MSQGTRECDTVVDNRNRHCLEVRVYDALTEVPGQQEAWNNLVDVSAYPNVFLRWEWITSWWKWFGGGRQLYLIVVLDGAEIVGIAPLYVATMCYAQVFPCRKLAFVGAGGPTFPEYLGPIIHRDYLVAVVEQFVSHLQMSDFKWDAIEFSDVPPDDAGTTALVEAISKCYPVVSNAGEVCEYLDLPETFEALLEGLSRHSRQRRKRQLRRAKEECDVQLKILDSADALAAAFPTMIKLSSSARGRFGQTSPFTRSKYAGFHQEVIEKLIRERVATVYVLTFQDIPVAFLYGFVYHDKYYAFQMGFDSEIAKYSPGDVLFQLVFNHLIKRKVKEFDCLRGDEPYKRRYADKQRRTETTFVYRRRGILYLNRWLQSRVMRRLRHWVKRKAWFMGRARRNRH